MDEQSSIHDTVDALKSIMQEPHMQRYYAAQERRERLAEGEDTMTDNERPTTISAAPAKPANDWPPKWSYERLEAEYREICNNLHNLIDETGIGFGNGGEKIDRIVRNAFHQQQAELAVQRTRADGLEAKAAAMRSELQCIANGTTGDFTPDYIANKALNETIAGSHLLARLESVTIEAKANGDTAMQWKQMFESQQKRAEQAEAERDKFENRYNGLVELIKQQYIDTFVLCWLNVPIEMAVELLAKYAVEGWKIAPNNPDRQAVKDGE